MNWKEIGIPDGPKRVFVALVKGNVNQTGRFHFSLKNELDEKQDVITNYSPLQNFGLFSYLKVWTDTDCNYQIQRHFSKRSMNIIGDCIFGNKRWNDFFEEEMGLRRLFLHTHYLFLDLKSYNRILEIHCPLPANLESILKKVACCCQSSVWDSFVGNQHIS